MTGVPPMPPSETEPATLCVCDNCPDGCTCDTCECEDCTCKTCHHGR
jgi:hypothetical protein